MYSDLSENVSDIINLLENNYNLSSQFINQNKASIEYILNDYNLSKNKNIFIINNIICTYLYI